eukprot:6492277-Alexandrium_andersonii.AAC.1
MGSLESGSSDPEERSELWRLWCWGAEEALLAAHRGLVAGRGSSERAVATSKGRGSVPRAELEEVRPARWA